MSFSPSLKVTKIPARDDVIYGTGVLYKGTLDENQRCGPGVLTFPDGSLYEGLFFNNQRNGNGLQVWHDGSKYSGQFSSDLRQGQGRQLFPDGSSYVGTFVYDRRHGTGKYTQSDGSSFEGAFYLDKREGYGTLAFPDGGTFQGLYKADQREGPGVWTRADGSQDVGLWHGDKLVKLCCTVADGFRMADHPEFEYDRQDHVPSISFNLREANRNDIIRDILMPPAPFDYSDSQAHAPAVFSFCLGPESLGLDRQTFEREFFSHLQNAADGAGSSAASAVAAATEQSVTEPAWNATPSCVAMQQHVLRHARGPRKPPAACEQALRAVLSGGRPAGVFRGGAGALERDSLELLEAARDGRSAAVRKLLMADAVSVDVGDSGGCTALLLAAKSCHIDVINCLLDYGADINKVSDEGVSPLSECFVFYYPPETFKKNIAESTYVIVTAAGTSGETDSDSRAANRSRNSDERVSGGKPEKAATKMGSNGSVGSASQSVKEAASEAGSRAPMDGAAASDGCKLSVNQEPSESVALGQASSSADSDDSGGSGSAEAAATAGSTAGPDNGLLLHPPPAQGDPAASTDRVSNDSAKLQASSADDGDDGGAPGQEDVEPAASESELNRTMPEEEEKESDGMDSDRVTVEHQVSVNRKLIETSAMLLSRNERAVKSASSAASAASSSQEAVLVLAARIAERAKRWETIQLLLRRGANPSVSTVPLPPLIFAVKAADVDAVKLLLLRGADVNVKLSAKSGCLTPLHIAVATPGAEGVHIVEHLLNALADPDARALPDASYLMPRSGDDDDEDGGLAATGAGGAGGRDRQRSASVGGGGGGEGTAAAPGTEGRTPLHIACSRDDDYELASRIVGLLLEHNANPDVVCNGHSPLSLAIVSGNDLAVDKLLKHGANPSLALTHGNGSALCVAAHTAYEHRRDPAKRVALVDKLIAAGADILALTTIGSKKVSGTAVDYAYHVFNQDRRIAHMPYHALTHTERETYNARRHLLAHLGDILRDKFIERENRRLEEERQLGTPSRTASARFHYAAGGRARDISSAPTRAGPAAIQSASTSKVTFGHEEFFGIVPTASQLAAGVVTIGPFGTKSVRILESLEEQSKVTVVRKSNFKYCYNCGRSVGVRLTACTRCKEVYFCSKPCKLRAWNARHKDECVRIQGSKTSSAAHPRKSAEPAQQDPKARARAALLDGHRVVTHKGAAMDRSYNLLNQADQRIAVPIKGRSHSLGDLAALKKAPSVSTGSAVTGDKAARALRDLKLKEKADAAMAQVKAEVEQRLAYEDNYSFE